MEELDDSEGGVKSRLADLEVQLRRHDPPLAALLERQGLAAQFFALRWITTLLSREFELPDTIRLWDSLLCDPRRFEFARTFCLAMVRQLRAQFAAWSRSYASLRVVVPMCCLSILAHFQTLATCEGA